MTAYDFARERYASFGIDTEKALSTLKSTPISVHCWQGDDVVGFDQKSALSGGIQVTGNYPGKATNPDELMADFEKAMSYVGGTKRLNLHASYAIFGEDGFVDRDAIEPKHFAPWVEFAKKNGYGIDFNPTFYSHPMVKDGMTLASPDEEVRKFWVNHGIVCRRIAAYFAKELGTPCLYDLWIPDGLKDVPADRLGPRKRLEQSLNEIFAEKLDGVIDAVESKVFGIGLEAYTVGSADFYTAYAAKHPGIYNLIDNGHYHPTEDVSDKISSSLCFFDKVPLHVTRPMRWDSDHVVRFNDDLQNIASEIVRCDALDKVLIALDFFDGSINRIAAWVIGTRNMQKALLGALLVPHKDLAKLQDECRFTELMAMQEAIKMLPMGVVWDEFLAREGKVADEKLFAEIDEYEKAVLLKRG